MLLLDIIRFFCAAVVGGAYGYRKNEWLPPGIEPGPLLAISFDEFECDYVASCGLVYHDYLVVSFNDY